MCLGFESAVVSQEIMLLLSSPISFLVDTDFSQGLLF